jgi:hypothetical protein
LPSLSFPLACVAQLWGTSRSHLLAAADAASGTAAHCELRKVAAQHIRSHQEDFLPYLIKVRATPPFQHIETHIHDCPL